MKWRSGSVLLPLKPRPNYSDESYEVLTSKAPFEINNEELATARSTTGILTRLQVLEGTQEAWSKEIHLLCTPVPTASKSVARSNDGPPQGTPAAKKVRLDTSASTLAPTAIESTPGALVAAVQEINNSILIPYQKRDTSSQQLTDLLAKSTQTLESIKARIQSQLEPLLVRANENLQRIEAVDKHLNNGGDVYTTLALLEEAMKSHAELVASIGPHCGNGKT
jgi:hypothetical protein